jgi:hypothetical protein
MNQILQKAISELSKLPELEQEEIGKHILDLTARHDMDAKLAAAESRGGEIASADLFKGLREKYAL